MAEGKEAGQSKAQLEDKGKGKEAALKVKEPVPAKTQAVAQEKKATNPLALLPVSKGVLPQAKT